MNQPRWSLKKRLVLAAVLLVVIAGGILAAYAFRLSLLANRLEPTSPAADQTRLTLAEASQLLLYWYQQQKPDLNPQVTVPVKEMTTTEIWNRLQVQVFQVSGDIYMYDTFLLKGSQVTPLGIGFGGMGVTTLAVTDLDRDNQPELLYSYSFGSGIHQSCLGMYGPTLPGNGNLNAGARLIFGDLLLEKVDDYQVEVRAEMMASGSLRIGQVALQGKGDARKLVLVLDQGLPQTILDNLTIKP